MLFPKDDKTYKWTSHIKDKMVFYRFSAQMIKNILNKPDRREEGIAPNTLAVMKRHDTPKRKEEMWVMYCPTSKSKLANPPPSPNGYGRAGKAQIPASPAGRPKSKIILISAWRYPGITKPGRDIPIPDDVLSDIQEWMKL